MKINYIKETNTVEVEFESDEMLNATLEDLETELDGEQVSIFRPELEKLYEELLDKGKASRCLDDLETSNTVTNNDADTEDDDKYIETENEGNIKANTVGNWLAKFIADGYRIQKAQILRGQVIEELEFKGELLIRKQHLCGQEITLLKMIVDEMSSTSSGCAGRLIYSIDSYEEDDIIYTKLFIEGNITLRYKLVKTNGYNNKLKF